MELMRVLVVEDNSVVADAVAEGLRDEGMAVDVAYDGPAGLDKVTVNTYDVIVLDRDLPRLHGGQGTAGMGVCRTGIGRGRPRLGHEQRPY